MVIQKSQKTPLGSLWENDNNIFLMLKVSVPYGEWFKSLRTLHVKLNLILSQ